MRHNCFAFNEDINRGIRLKATFRFQNFARGSPKLFHSCVLYHLTAIVFPYTIAKTVSKHKLEMIGIQALIVMFAKLSQS